MDREKLERQIARYPICEYAFIRTEEIRFLDKVRYICETECPQYGKSWSCPPAVGTVQECRERCARFEGGFLFTTLAEVSDMENMEEMLATRMDHEKVTEAVQALFQEQCQEVLTLSTESCAICEKCAYPKRACLHPEQMHPCIESHGILLTKSIEENHMDYFMGEQMVLWFSLIFIKPV